MIWIFFIILYFNVSVLVVDHINTKNKKAGKDWKELSCTERCFIYLLAGFIGIYIINYFNSED